jgi:hypothetical protein
VNRARYRHSPAIFSFVEKKNRSAGGCRSLNEQQLRVKGMKKTSKTASRKTIRRGGAYPQKEQAYWREQHSKQPYAKNYSYEQFEHAYRTGYDSFAKNAGKKFGEVEESVAADYEQGKPDSALPWDTVRPAAGAVWDRLGGVISPRDPDRGIRGSI